MVAILLSHRLVNLDTTNLHIQVDTPHNQDIRHKHIHHNQDMDNQVIPNLVNIHQLSV